MRAAGAVAQDVHQGLARGPSEAWDLVAMKQKARTRRAAAKEPAKAQGRGGPRPAVGPGRHRQELGSVQ